MNHIQFKDTITFRMKCFLNVYKNVFRKRVPDASWDTIQKQNYFCPIHGALNIYPVGTGTFLNTLA
jgi:hypothetical protein